MSTEHYDMPGIMLVSRNRRVKNIDVVFESSQSKGEENRGNIVLGLDFSLPLYTQESGPKVSYVFSFAIDFQTSVCSRIA